VFYSLSLFVAVFLTYKGRNTFLILDSQESLQLQRLEEGLQEICIHIEQTGSIYSSRQLKEP
jgi:hypothetical protein